MTAGCIGWVTEFGLSQVRLPLVSSQTAVSS